MNYPKIKNYLQKYQLRPAFKRDLSLFSSSLIMRAYCLSLKKFLGFTYQAMGALSLQGDYCSLVNEDKVAQGVKRYLKKKSPAGLQKDLRQIDQDFEQIKKEFLKIKRISAANSFLFLQKISDLYPLYWDYLAVYNAFSRFFIKKENQFALPTRIINKIGRERNTIAALYPEIERAIKIAGRVVSKKLKLSSNLIPYLNQSEIDELILTKNISPLKRRSLLTRQKQYFHLYLTKTKQELIITDPIIIKKIKKDFFSVKTQETRVIKGWPVFKGKVAGVVYNLEQAPRKIPRKFILVAHYTHPRQLPLIRKSQGVITNEGGLLTHAAIICRELKKPGVIGTKIATQVLKTGDLIELDANQGVIKILKNE
jgi:phosphohistidine swiveling domain-containing protein